MAIGSGTFFSIRHMYTWFLFGFVLFFLPFLAIFQHTHTKTRKKQYYRFLCAFFAHWLCTFGWPSLTEPTFASLVNHFVWSFKLTTHTFVRSFFLFAVCTLQTPLSWMSIELARIRHWSIPTENFSEPTEKKNKSPLFHLFNYFVLAVNGCSGNQIVVICRIICPMLCIYLIGGRKIPMTNYN